MAVRDLGIVTAYGYAVAGGYTGTEQEFTALLGDLALTVEDLENMTVSVTTLEPNQQATASYADGVLSLGIPKGVAGEVQFSDLEPLAEKDGNYENFTAGSALQLISDKYTENKEPYLFRKSIAGDRELDTLVGGSVAWNQLVPTLDTVYAESGVTKTYENGVLTISSTIARNGVFVPLYYNTGHKYLIACDLKASAEYSVVLGATTSAYIGGRTIADNAWHTFAGIAYATRDGSLNAYIYATATYENLQAKNYCYFDLTAMFGTAVADRLYAMEQAQAGSGVAWFRNLFPKDYYAYNEGTLMSVKPSAHEMVGFNQWDEEWESGALDNNGVPIPDASSIRSKNFIPVLPNVSYYILTSGLCHMRYYDADKNIIGKTDKNGSGNVNTSDRIRVTHSNCRYIKFDVAGTTYNHDICISFSSDRNGEYQPYTKHTYALDNIELRGIPKLVDGEIQYDGDTYEADGTVTRKYGIRAYQSGDESDGSTMITDGTNTVYALTTPTTETADPFTSPQIVDAYGTERYVDERTVAVPVGHITKYPDNLREKLDGLPWDFSSLIAPTEKAYTATRNYTTGALLIVNNTLYKVTANIANGGTITPNTNVVATTLSEIISAL